MQAVEFLKFGQKLLDAEEKWAEPNFDLTFAMTECLAQMQLVVGDLDGCKETARQTMSRAKSVEMKLPSLLVELEAHMAANEISRVIASSNNALSILGVKLPRKVKIYHVAVKFLQVKRLLAKKTDEDILNLPIMVEDATKTAALKILLHLSMNCSLANRGNTAFYTSLIGVQMMLREGLTGYSAYGIGFYGMAELASGNYQLGFRFGRLAMTLLDRMQCKEAICPTICLTVACLSHWNEPLHELLKPIDDALNVAFDIGDVFYGTYGLSLLFSMENLLGGDAERKLEWMRYQYQRVQDLGQEDLLIWLQPPFQMLLNWRSEENWRHLTSLTGEIMDESTYLRRAKELKQNHLVTAVLIPKSTLQCALGFYEMAEKTFDELGDVLGKNLRFAYPVLSWYFWASFTFFELYRAYGKG